MSEPPPRLRDAHRYNDSINAMEVATSDRRFEQLIERRERLFERSRFGILALNGASAVGILSNYNGLRAESGFDPGLPLAFFAVGMIAALISIFFETNYVGHRASHLFGHLSHLRRMRATLDDHLTEGNERRLIEQLEYLSERSARDTFKIELDDSKDGLPNDFAFSSPALITMNLSGGAWIGGALTVLFGLLT